MNTFLRNIFVLAIGACSIAAWGKSFDIDLRPSPGWACRPSHRRVGRAAPLTAVSQGDVLRAFELDAGATNVGKVEVGDELAFLLFDDVRITLKLVEELPSPLGGDVFLAEVDGYDGVKNATVLRTDDGLTVDINDFANSKIYKIIATPQGVKTREIDARDDGKCSVCEAQKEDSDSRKEKSATISPQNNKSFGAVEKDDEAEEKYLDILIAFDTNAAKSVANDGGVTNVAQSAVATINASLANTGLTQYFRFRLVGVITLAVSTNTVEDAIYAIQRRDPGWDKVALERDACGADIASTLVVTSNNDGTTGIGYALGSVEGQAPYNVCTLRAVINGGLTMAHECGHNMGAGHGHAEGGQLFSYSKGAYLTGNDNKAYSTIMSYAGLHPSGSSRRIPYFSSPDYTYKGAAVGSADRDNTRTIKESWKYVINWREQVVPITYKVTFDIGAHGVHSGGGDLEQIVERGKAAIEPILTPQSGWEFIGWDKQFDNVKSNLKITALWKAYSPTFIIEDGVLTKVELNEYTEVTVPNSVTAIGKKAFKDCGDMVSVTLPNGITIIDEEAFEGCKLLTTINIPSSLARVGNNAFRNCSALTAVHVGSIEQWCALEFGNDLANPLKSAKNLYVNDKLVSELVIPASVKNIGAYSFYGCTSITNLTISGCVTNIGNNAFSYAGGLVRVQIAKGLKTIEAQAFRQCRALEKIYIPEGVQSIGPGAFEYCVGLKSVFAPSIAAWCEIEFANRFSNPLYYAQEFCVGGNILEDIEIPEGVEKINEYAFAFFEALKSVSLPESVTQIGENAFMNCTNLENISMPYGLESIGAGAFSGCTSLAEVTIPAGAEVPEGAFPEGTDVGWYKLSMVVYFDPSGGEVSVTAINVEYGSEYGQLPVPQREGYTFDYWMLDGSEVKNTDLVELKQDHTLVAHWKPIEYKILFHANNGTSQTSEQKFTYEEEVKLGANTFQYEDGEFLGWALSPNGKVAYADGAALEDYSLIVNGVINLYAVWLKYARVEADTAYNKAQQITAALYDARGELAGIVTFKIAKKDKKGNIKVSATVTTLEGKKVSAKAITIAVADEGEVSRATLAFKSPIGNMNFELDSEGRIELFGSAGEIDVANVGGNWTKTNSRVYVDIGEVPNAVLKNLLPDGVPVVPKGGKWSFAPAAQVKLVKDKSTGRYNVVVNTDNGKKSNLSAMKLSYTPKSAVFKGSFKIYALENNKLKKYTAKVTGLVVDGEGAGKATIPKPISKTCKVEVR